MAKMIANILSIALIYCGAVFGAGFASGREIFSFFSCYKTCGIVASFFAGFLFSYLGYKVSCFSKKENINNIDEYFKKIFPQKLATVFSFISTAFLVMSFSIMITGCGTLLSEQFGWSVLFSSSATLLLCYIVIKNKVSGLEKFNFFATPLMLIGVIFLCALCFFIPKTTPLDTSEVITPFISALLYVSYNMTSAVAVLVSTAKIAQNKREAALGGMLGGIMVLIPLVLMSAILAQHWEVASFPMPYFSLISNNFPKLSSVCFIVLFLAMTTTAVSSGVCLVENVETKKAGKSTLLLCLFAFFISFFPFSELVLTVYSAFGFIGIVLIGGIFLQNSRKREK